jgi:polo-like kinase 1
MSNQLRKTIPKTGSNNSPHDSSSIFKRQSDTNAIIIEKLAFKSKSNNNQEKIRKYIKGRLLGKGGFAKCYELICQDNNKVFAAKMLPQSNITTDRQRQKLMTEIKIHKSLHHQKIVAFEHVFEDTTNVYILLELCQNQTLNELFLRRKRLTEVEVQCYIFQLIKALQYLHSHRVIHRDLKLGNLFLNDKMELKVGDFGLATKLDFVGERKKTVCGTPNYIAPEVLYGSGHSYEVDIWAVGVIIYTLLIGKPPFETKDVKTTYNKIKKGEFSFPVTSKISLAAKNLIKKILIVDPKRRPTLSAILSDEFLNQGIAIPKLLPISTLALPPPIDYIKKYIPDIDQMKISNSQIIRNQSLIKSRLGSSTQFQSSRILIPDMVNNNLILKSEIWVTKWVDFSSTFGLGYILNNGHIGLYFNDTTKIILNPIEKTFTYIDKKMVEDQELLYTFSMKEYPDDIKMKVYFFNQFKKYIDEENNKNKTDEESKQKDVEEKEKKSPEKHKHHRHKKKKKEKEKEKNENGQNVNASMKPIQEIEFIFMNKWVKTKYAYIFRFSNKAVQACFKDKTEIFMHTINETITYTNKNGDKIIYPISKSLNSSNYEMNKRVKYTMNVLTYMIKENINKKEKNDLIIKDKAGEN